jgi:hypothetical protein
MLQKMRVAAMVVEARSAEMDLQKIDSVPSLNSKRKGV